MNHHILLIFISFVFIFLNFGCEEDNKEQAKCDQYTIISESEYITASQDNLSITGMEINGNCLKISFSASGCDGSSWIVKLIDSGDTFYTDPPQRDLILSLENKEECLAVIGKEISFDIESLQVSGGRVILNITNIGDEILYEY
ncbi:MAG: hypothetical protein JSV32_00185 [Dehalococcoidia bacterium]|nr:MAG: hypothetical protein JSV32_00185 [Dehalococcoidia bacterium]